MDILFKLQVEATEQMTQNPGCIPHRPHAEVTPRALKMYAE